MILRRAEMKMLRSGRRWFDVAKEPRVKPGQVVRVRSSSRDHGFEVTIDAIVPRDGRWRVVCRLGDCTEHPRFLAWSGLGASGLDSARGYSEERWRSMLDEPEAVDDVWLRRFTEKAA